MILILRPQVDFADRITAAITSISGSMTVASVGGPRHPDAHEFRKHRSRRQTYHRLSSVVVRPDSRGEGFPYAFILFVHGVAVAFPVLHLEVARKRFGPLNADCIDALLFVERNHDPLRMQ